MAAPGLDLARVTPVHHLWPGLVERLGPGRSLLAVQLRRQTALVGASARLVLLINRRRACLQLLQSS